MEVLEKIRILLQSDGVPLETDKEEITFQSRCSNLTVPMRVILGPQLVLLLSQLPFYVPLYRRTEVAEAMTRANFGLYLGASDMMAYLAMMAPRLMELRNVLKSTGSIYLHCDPTASHYLKLLMDAIFGPTSFRNEIIWRRSGSHNSAKRYGPNHDTLLFYTKTRDYYWRKQYRPYLNKYVDWFFKKKDVNGRYRSQTLTGSGIRNGESGKRWRGFDPTAKGRHWAFPSALSEDLGLEDDLSLHVKLETLWQEDLIASTVDALPEYRQYLKQEQRYSITGHLGVSAVYPGNSLLRQGIIYSLD